MIRALLLALSLALPTRAILAEPVLPLDQSYDLAAQAILAFDQSGEGLIDRLSAAPGQPWTQTLSIFVPPRLTAPDPWLWWYAGEQQGPTGNTAYGANRQVDCIRFSVTTGIGFIPDMDDWQSRGALAYIQCDVQVPLPDDTTPDVLVPLAARLAEEFSKVELSANYGAPPGSAPIEVFAQTPLDPNRTTVAQTSIRLDLGKVTATGQPRVNFATMTIIALLFPPNS